MNFTKITLTRDVRYLQIIDFKYFKIKTCSVMRCLINNDDNNEDVSHMGYNNNENIIITLCLYIFLLNPPEVFLKNIVHLLSNIFNKVTEIMRGLGLNLSKTI